MLLTHNMSVTKSKSKKTTEPKMPVNGLNQGNADGTHNHSDRQWFGKLTSVIWLSEKDGEGLLRGETGIYFFIWHKNTTYT